MIAEFRKDMMRKFEMTNLGLLHHFLGIGVIRRPSGIFIHQQKYVETLLKNFELKGFKSVVTPLISNKSYAKMMVMFLQMRLYWKIVGSLLHLTSTKLDIMFTPSLYQGSCIIQPRCIWEQLKGFHGIYVEPLTLNKV